MHAHVEACVARRASPLSPTTSSTAWLMAAAAGPCLRGSRCAAARAGRRAPQMDPCVCVGGVRRRTLSGGARPEPLAAGNAFAHPSIAAPSECAVCGACLPASPCVCAAWALTGAALCRALFAVVVAVVTRPARCWLMQAVCAVWFGGVRRWSESGSPLAAQPPFWSLCVHKQPAGMRHRMPPLRASRKARNGHATLVQLGDVGQAVLFVRTC